MDAYLVVESPVRRKLEELLQTWKQPVPGSTSSQPVFSSEITRKIDNALIKARTAALQQQQKQMRQNQALGLDRQAGRTPPPQQFRNTPTPPVANGNAPYTNGFDFSRGTPVQQNGIQKNNHNPNPNPYNTPATQSASVGIQQLSIQGPTPHAGGNVDTLQSDISSLIESCQATVARDPRNLEMQSRLQALVDLRKILQTQTLPMEQLADVREQVRALANPNPHPPVVAPPQPPPQPQMPQMPQMPLPLTSQDLASLLATATHATATHNMPFPQVPPPMPMVLPVSMPQAQIHPPPPPPPPPPAASFGGDNGMDPASLFAALQKSGLLANLPPPPPLPTAGAPPPFPMPIPGNMPRNMPNFAAPQNSGKRDWRSIDVEMNSMSLKM